jgi:hypothetical protein
MVRGYVSTDRFHPRHEHGGTELHALTSDDDELHAAADLLPMNS